MHKNNIQKHAKFVFITFCVWKLYNEPLTIELLLDISFDGKKLFCASLWRKLLLQVCSLVELALFNAQSRKYAGYILQPHGQ